MAHFFRKIHTILYFASVLFYFILAFPLLYFYTRNPQKYFRQIVFFRKWISLFATTTVGIRFQVREEVPIDWSKPYVICPNHTSILDITAINYTCPQQFSFMGKVELLKNPVTRIFFKTIDIAVNRQSKISAFKAFKRADILIKEGKSVVIFPEGRIDDEYPPQLHGFKSGPFRLAIENHVQILPIVIHDAWRVLWDEGKKYGSRPGTIHISILPPIDTRDISAEAREKLQTDMYIAMREHWKTGNLHENVKNI
ncbi:1-acyl-sn-glycerol-3-phosphate acyltransferase [Parapusillimonas sp. SGNA-6]|uniref:lysophospholipid acyltransferase family protein n=1 Tax=Parapedobacter sp. SGR-10 TaxID=2710879 RepID=UPI0013D8D667|nr:lysophospholipid acyltransferase family protein [Parapedobacter sp. SGR-10]NGF55056.1 1-acyl-sn-glycerol-3-phosphate acyltransferase [Parapedobacter sp. SGR-10]NGM90057.1 1-acyl-sn-glycerol-3-phosphate acyltransferase [Parapusillimonas sp. SGNA-6]